MWTAVVQLAACLACATPVWGQSDGALETQFALEAHVAAALPNASGEITVIIQPSQGQGTTVQYQLLPSVAERHPGNAALAYSKVALSLPYMYRASLSYAQLAALLESPLDVLADNAALEEFFLINANVYADLERAATSDTCDWQMPIFAGSVIGLSHEQIEPIREVARILAVRIRWHIARGEFDDALDWLKVSFAAATHVSQAPTFLAQLAALAMLQTIHVQALELAQQPNCPSLYGMYASRATPFLQMEAALDFELHLLELQSPELFKHVGRNAEPASPEEWTRLLDQAITLWQDVLGSPDQNSTTLRLRVAGGYPLAKASLCAQGMSEQEVDAMPVAQAVLTQSVLAYQQARDHVLLDWRRPFWQPVSPAMQPPVEAGIIPFADLLLTPTQQIKWRREQLDRNLAFLQLVEALRLQAGTAPHADFPARLSDLKWPIPNDPATGKPFEYSANGQQATVHLKAPAGFTKNGNEQIYHLRLRQ